jgi:hypothetical protein
LPLAPMGSSCAGRTHACANAADCGCHHRRATVLPYPHDEVPSTASLGSFGATSDSPGMPRIRFPCAPNKQTDLDTGTGLDADPQQRVARAAAGLLPVGFLGDTFQWRQGIGGSEAGAEAGPTAASASALHGPGPTLVVVEGGEVTLRRRLRHRHRRRHQPPTFLTCRGAVLHAGTACVVPPTWEVLPVQGRAYHVAVAAILPDADTVSDARR